jgi:hypothetical protein
MFSQFKIHLYANITCVMSDMQFWHNINVGIAFWGQGLTKVSLDQQSVLKFHSTLNALIFAILSLTIIIIFHRA